MRCVNKGLLIGIFVMYCHILPDFSPVCLGFKEEINHFFLHKAERIWGNAGWVTLFQHLATHWAINTHRTAQQPFTGISHGKPGRIKAPPPPPALSEMFKDFIRDGQCEVSHFYRDSWYSCTCNFWYLMVLLYCLMILLWDKWELDGMLHSKTNYQLLPVKPGLPAGICVSWLWFYSTSSLMI